MADSDPERDEVEGSAIQSGVVRGDDADDTDASALAAQLRLVIGRLVRQTRATEARPHSYYAVLGSLNREGPMTTSDLAHAHFVRPQSMARTVAQLAEDDLVRFEPHASDRRKTLVALTSQGEDALRTGMSRRAGWLRDLIEAELTPQEQQVLAAAVPLLERVASHTGDAVPR